MRKTLSVVALMFCGLWSLQAVAGSSICDGIVGNLVANCGFESGNFNGWTVGGNTANPGSNYYGVDGFDANSGNFGAYMSEDLLSSSSAVTLSQTLATVAGQQYGISFWLQQDTPPAVGYNHSFTAIFGGSTMLTLTPTVSAPGPNGVWTEYTFYETATSSSTLLSFSFVNDDGYWSFDDASVVTPEPATGLLAGTAVFALLLLRRKYCVV